MLTVAPSGMMNEAVSFETPSSFSSSSSVTGIVAFDVAVENAVTRVRNIFRRCAIGRSRKRRRKTDSVTSMWNARPETTVTV